MLKCESNQVRNQQSISLLAEPIMTTEVARPMGTISSSVLKPDLIAFPHHPHVCIFSRGSDMNVFCEL